MNDYVITESGMNFIASTDDTYYIEKSPAYSSVGNGVKAVEFVRKMKDRRLWLVEAKACFPDENDKNKRGEWIKMICDKFLHSLNLYCAVKLNVISDSLPVAFDESKILFVLVIKEQALGRCEKVQEVLKNRLLPYLRIWKTNILVINYDKAKEYQLVG
jgi:hypothetical protein